MRRAPSVYTPSTLQTVIGMNCVILNPGFGWQPARPRGVTSIKSRIMLAWEVFTGRADVLRWPGQ